MATTSKKQEPVLVQINDEVIELKGAELDLWIEESNKYQLEAQTRQNEIENLIQSRISAYKKLGLTQEEINAIL